MTAKEPPSETDSDRWFREAYGDRHRERELDDDPESLSPAEQIEHFKKLKAHMEMKKLDQAADPELEPYSVNWHSLTEEVVAGFARLIESGEGEVAVLAYVKKYPALLVQQLSGGHGRWVIPGVRLGAEFVTDFIIAEKSSVGFEWYAVEFEGITAQMFTQAGDPSATLTHAVRQIGDWRSWLGQNLAYAERLRSANGLGLRDIDPEVPGLVVIGRTIEATDAVKSRRRRLAMQNRIAIRSYDWLLARAISGVRT